MIGLTDFLVRIEIDTGALGASEVERLKQAEGERARALMGLGHLVGLWRIPGRWANYGLWRAPDEVALQDLIDTLPLRPYMTLDIQKLENHPSAPGSQPVADVRRGVIELPPLPALSIRRRALRRATEPIEVRPLPELVARRRSSTLATHSASQQSWHSDDPACLVRVSEITLDFSEVLVRSAPVDRNAAALTLLVPALISAAVRTSAVFGGVETEDRHVSVEVRGAEHRVAFLEGASLESPHVERDNEAESILTISHSGAYGMRVSQASGRTYGVSADLGAVERAVTAVELPEGGEGMRVRSVATITLQTPASVPLEVLGLFLRELRSVWQATKGRNA